MRKKEVVIMFCPKCGTQIPENDHYCPTCGEPVISANSVPDESDHTAMFEAQDIERTKLLSAICYLSLLFIVVALLLEPNSKFLRYHINQSIILQIFGVLSGLVMVVPFVGWIAGVIASVAVIVFLVMGVVRAFKGEAKDLPLIGKYTIVHYD